MSKDRACIRYPVPGINYLVQYYDEVHKLCDSHTGFSFFDLDFIHAFITGKTKEFTTAPLLVSAANPSPRATAGK